MIRRSPEQLAVADHVRRAKARGPEAVAAARRMQAEVDRREAMHRRLTEVNKRSEQRPR